MMITSHANEKVKRLRKLMRQPKSRDAEGVFVVEGARFLREAPAADLREIYVSESFYARHQAEVAEVADQSGCEPEILSDPVYQGLSDTRSPQGILLTVRQSQFALSDLLKPGPEPKLLLLLETIQDPGNLGTLFRSAEAAGVTGVVMSADSADLYNPKAVRATMGSIFRLPFCYVDDLPRAMDDLHQSGILIYAAHLAGERAYDEEDYRGSSAFLIGNEGQGLSPQTASCADRLVRIPMCGQVESLNAAAAGAVLLFEAARQRRG